MKTNTNSNAYTIVYAAVMVVIVAFLLAFVSQALKSKQNANVALDLKKQVLYSLNIRNLTNDKAEEAYAEIVKQEPNDLQTEKGNAYYTCIVDGKEIKVFPMKGMGLWGPISGFLAVEDDDNTIYGAYFNHESETAGLGAEIKDSRTWQEKFIGKKLHKEGVDGIALSVVKKVTDPDTQVDAVTGATLTSNGVNDMIKESLSGLAEQTECPSTLDNSETENT